MRLTWAKIVTPEEGRHESLPLLVHDGDYVWFIRNGFKEWLSTNPPLPEGYPPTYYPSSFPPPRARAQVERRSALECRRRLRLLHLRSHCAVDRRHV